MAKVRLKCPVKGCTFTYTFFRKIDSEETYHKALLVLDHFLSHTLTEIWRVYLDAAKES